VSSSVLLGLEGAVLFLLLSVLHATQTPGHIYTSQNILKRQSKLQMFRKSPVQKPHEKSFNLLKNEAHVQEYLKMHLSDTVEAFKKIG